MPSLLRLALPVLAFATTVLAACDQDITLKSSGDASSLSSCSTYEGTITIDSETGDDMALDGISELDGDLILTGNSAIRRLSGSDLETITGELRVEDVSQLASLNFPKLTSVDKMTLIGLANLRSLEFSAKVNKLSSLKIENTQLQNLEGLNPETAKSIQIASNDGIAEISMQITNVTEMLDISHNNEDLQVVLSNLESANNMTFRACAKIDLSSLEQVNKGSLGIYESEKLESIIAPNLTRIDSALTISENSNLLNISFPKLESVGGNLQIANNTNLREISQFPELETVKGALDLSGNLTKVETPKLNLVVGVFNLQSTGDLGGVCEDFYDPLNQKKKLGPQKQYVCKDELEKASTAGSTPSGGAKPTGAAPSLNVQSVYLGFAGLAAVLLV